MTDHTFTPAQPTRKCLKLAEKYERILDRARTMRRTSMEMRVFEDDMVAIIAALRASQPPADPVETEATSSDGERENRTPASNEPQASASRRSQDLIGVAGVASGPSDPRLSAGKETELLATLVFEAVRFSIWAAGQGIMAQEGEPTRDPEDFLYEYSKALDIDDWDGLAEVARAHIRAAPQGTRK